MLLLLLFFGHQHKAASVKTNKNNGCDDFFFFFLLLLILLLSLSSLFTLMLIICCLLLGRNMLVTAFVICLVICLHGMSKLISNLSANANATHCFLHTVWVNEAVHSDVRETVANVDLFRVFTNDRVACLLTHTGGTGVSRLTRGLTTLPQGGSRSL